MLKRIPIHLLEVGFVLPGDVYDADGRVLLRSGRCLTSEEVTLVRRYKYSGLFGGDKWPDGMLPAQGPVVKAAPRRRSVSNSPTLSVDQLRPGMVLGQAIYDSGKVLLLAAGTTITQRFLQLLARRNITFVTLGDETRELTVEDRNLERAKSVEEALEKDLDEEVPDRPISGAERPRLPAERRALAIRDALKCHAVARDVVGDVFQTAVSGGLASGEEVREAVDDLAKIITSDFDVAPLIVGMHEAKGDYLFDHCVDTSVTSMSIGAQLGWKRDRMVELGMGTMLQDIGMLGVPDTIRLARRRLTPDEWRQVEAHPYHALDQLDRISDIPEAAKFVAYQSHERGDRSGYPKQRSGMYLHPFAKVVAIADSYAAMTHARPYRPAMPPYQAARSILTESAAGKYDQKFVRAFLDAVSLFPIGSYVELSDGSQCRVIRSNPGMHTRPVVERLAGDGEGRVVDMSKALEVKVVRAFAKAPASV